MINVVVVSIREESVGRPMSAQFGPNGGTIGRSNTNTLVLDDPDRTVSRVHASIQCRDGVYFVVDRGSNPLHHNGKALGEGNEAALAEGDCLMLGRFELQVSAVQTAQKTEGETQDGPAEKTGRATSASPGSDDPFADLLEGLAPPKPAAPLVGNERDAVPEFSRFPDPMAKPAERRDLLAGDGSSRKTSRNDTDNFSDLGISPGARVPDIDSLFGGGGPSVKGTDPLDGSPLDDGGMRPNTAGDSDPLAALQRAGRPSAAPRSDHVPVGQAGYSPPRQRVAAPQPIDSSAPAPDTKEQAIPPQSPLPEPGSIQTRAAPASTAMPDGSTDAAKPASVADAGALDDLIGAAPLAPGADPLADWVSDVPGKSGQQPASEAASPSPRAQKPVTALPPPPSPARAPAIDGSMDPAGHGAATPDALTAAFLRGIASDHKVPDQLTPELMERIGAMLRTSVEGTLHLLLTRQEFKREVRAEVTMIAAAANNPLKFSPTVEVALGHLLGDGVRGFMAPEPAMRDAFDDLRAHQFGLMVGLRAALAEAIARFEPAELEKKIAAKTKLDALFSASRKAKLWDQFIALYGEIAVEAEDDFHNLFGKAFLKAYEEQMARLKDANTDERSP